MSETYKVCKEAVEKWGYTAQLHMAIEEMAELTQAICKAMRADSSISSHFVVEEIADVELMVTQLRMMAGPALVDLYKQKKLDRLKERLEREAGKQK